MQDTSLLKEQARDLALVESLTHGPHVVIAATPELWVVAAVPCDHIPGRRVELYVDGRRCQPEGLTP